MWKWEMYLRKVIPQYQFTWNDLHNLINYYYNLHKISEKKYNSNKNMKVILDI